MSCTVVFDGVTLDGPITCEDASILRDIVTRHRNRMFPHAQGTRPIEPVMDELDRTLTWFVSGRTDPTDTPYADRETGVEENLEFYRALFDPRGGTAGTGEYPIELHYAGDVFEGSAQVLQYAQVRTGPTTARIITRLIISAGELIASGS